MGAVELTRFAVLYCIFVGPVVLALFREMRNPPEAWVAVPATSARGIFSWFLALLVSSAGLMVLGKRTGLRMTHRSGAQMLEDIRQLLGIGTLIAAVGGVGARLSHPAVVSHDLRLSLLPLYAFFLLVFTLLFHATDSLTHLTLTTSLLSDLPAICIVGVSACIILAFVANHNMLASQDPDGGTLYRLCIALGLALHGAIFFVRWPGHQVKLHVHHWYWPVPLAMMCCFFQSDVSLLGCAMFTAISVHGIAIFGCDPVFYPQKKEASRHEHQVEVVGCPRS